MDSSRQVYLPRDCVLFYLHFLKTIVYTRYKIFYFPFPFRRSDRSIGKFCSNNAGKPFAMYSDDGYATIDYNVGDYATGGGFTLYYQVKPKKKGYLDASLTSSKC